MIYSNTLEMSTGSVRYRTVQFLAAVLDVPFFFFLSLSSQAWLWLWFWLDPALEWWITLYNSRYYVCILYCMYIAAT